MKKYICKFAVATLAVVPLAACGTDDTPAPQADACAIVQEVPSYAVMLRGGPGKTALGTIAFGARSGHDNVQVMIDAEPMAQSFDIVADPCTVDARGNAVFNLHPPVAADPTQVDMRDGDRWTFSLPPPGPHAAYAITDTTGASFANPVTPGWTGEASLPPPPKEGGLGDLLK